MNERIKELVKQSLESTDKRPNNGYVFPVEKFAELIVRECVWQVVKDNEVPQNIQVLIGERFKQHFGVEE
jgi:hypothetical protein